MSKLSWLNGKGMRVRLAVVVDAYGKDPYTVPPNVAVAANLYQRDFGPVKGEPLIVAEDPARTRILGNWRYTYEGRDVPMPGEPGIRKWFMRSHLKMEYDPAPWARVKELITSAINMGTRPCGMGNGGVGQIRALGDSVQGASLLCHAARRDRAPGRTPPRFDRSVSVPKAAFATSPTALAYAFPYPDSERFSAPSHDAVHVALITDEPLRAGLPQLFLPCEKVR